VVVRWVKWGPLNARCSASVVQTVTVTSETGDVETTKTKCRRLVYQRRIDNLDRSNGRNYINFTLTIRRRTRNVALLRSVRGRRA